MDKYQEAYNEYSKLGHKIDDLMTKREKALKEMISAKTEEYVQWITNELDNGNLTGASVQKALHMLAGDIKNIVSR